MHIRAGSTRPCSASHARGGDASSTSTTPHSPPEEVAIRAAVPGRAAVVDARRPRTRGSSSTGCRGRARAWPRRSGPRGRRRTAAGARRRVAVNAGFVRAVESACAVRPPAEGNSIGSGAEISSDSNAELIEIARAQRLDRASTDRSSALEPHDRGLGRRGRGDRDDARGAGGPHRADEREGKLEVFDRRRRGAGWRAGRSRRAWRRTRPGRRRATRSASCRTPTAEPRSPPRARSAARPRRAPGSSVYRFHQPLRSLMNASEPSARQLRLGHRLLRAARDQRVARRSGARGRISRVPSHGMFG